MLRINYTKMPLNETGGGMNNQTYLVHYGVQGMRWGHRKRPDITNSPGFSSKKFRESVVNDRSNPNFVKQRKEVFKTKKREYKALKKQARKDPSKRAQLDSAKKSMKKAGSLLTAQRIVGHKTNLNERYTSDDGSKKALLDQVLTGNANKVNRYLNAGETYAKSMGKVAVQQIAKNSAINLGAYIAAPYLGIGIRELTKRVTSLRHSDDGVETDGRTDISGSLRRDGNEMGS